MDFLHYSSIKLILIMILFVFILEYIILLKFFKFIKAPFKRISVNKTETLFPNTEKLYLAYLLVPKENLKFFKLQLETEDFTNSYITNLIDAFQKIVLSVVIAGVTIATTISIASLTFFKDNKELQKNYFTWVESIQIISQNIKSGLDGFTIIIFITAVLFICYANSLFIKSVKEKTKNKHLKFIELVEKERANELT